MFQGVLGMIGIDVVEGDGLTKGRDAVCACLSVLMRPDAPHEERPDDFAVFLHECLERKDVPVVERAHDASRMQGGCVALVVLDGVGIGVQDERRGNEFAAYLGSTLHKVVVVRIHASYHVFSERRPKLVHQGSFLALAECLARGEHHFKLDAVGLEVAQDSAPEEDIVVALNVSHNLPHRVLGSELLCELEVLRVEMFLQTLCHKTLPNLPLKGRLFEL